MKRKKLKDQFIYWIAWTPSLLRNQTIKNNKIEGGYTQNLGGQKFRWRRKLVKAKITHQSTPLPSSSQPKKKKLRKSQTKNINTQKTGQLSPSSKRIAKELTLLLHHAQPSSAFNIFGSTVICSISSSLLSCTTEAALVLAPFTPSTTNSRSPSQQ
jgi:hypothetical protein